MTLRRTPLYDRHAERSATFTEFGGWEMPVSYESIKQEHRAVREEVGVFDVSHMGEIEVEGPDAAELCQRLLTNDVAELSPGRAQYSTVLNADGIILDDVMCYCLTDEHYLFIPNAGKDEMMVERWTSHRDKWGLEAEVRNQTTAYGMLAIQGPAADEAMGRLDCPVESINRRDIVETSILGRSCFVAGTGYTGEHGYEILSPSDHTAAIDETLAVTPCGLGARDTLRLEMGYVLAGNEFDVDDNPRTPLEAGLDFVVALDARPRFVGHDVIEAQQEKGPEQRLRGFILSERGVPRTGYPITDGTDTTIGSVTSGTISPTMNEPIGLGYVDTDYTANNEYLYVKIRGAEQKARIVTPPFLDAER